MSAIEVRRSTDGAVQAFDVSDVGSGAVVSFVTQQDPNADGLVRFLNQAAEGGNALAPSLDRFPKIVEDGSLIASGGNETVNWSQKQDGYEVEFANASGVSQSRTQSVELTVDVDDLKGSPQTIVNSNGLRLWERDGKILATISNPDVDAEEVRNTVPGAISGIKSYEGEVYFFTKFNFGNFKVSKWDPQAEQLVSVDQGESFGSTLRGDMIVYDGKLWAQNDNQSQMKSYDGSSWTVERIFQTGRGGLQFKPDGSKLYVSDAVIHQFDLSTSWEVDSGEYVGVSRAPLPSGDFLNAGGSYIKSDGTKIWVTDKDGDTRTIAEYDFGTPWEIDTLSFVAEYDFSSEVGTSPDDITFKPDGTKMFIKSGRLYEFDLSNAWDPSSASFTGNDLVTGRDTFSGNNTGTTMFFHPDGTKVYFGDFDFLVERKLSTPWDVGSFTNLNLYQIDEVWDNTVDEGIWGITFKPDGNNMYLASRNPDDDAANSLRPSIPTTNSAVKQFSLSSSWDVSTRTFEKSSFPRFESNITCSFIFRGDVFFLDSQNPILHRYDGNEWSQAISEQEFEDNAVARIGGFNTGTSGTHGAGVWNDKVWITGYHANFLGAMYSWTPETGLQVEYDFDIKESESIPMSNPASAPAYKGELNVLTAFSFNTDVFGQAFFDQANGFLNESQQAFDTSFSEDSTGVELSSRMGSAVYDGDLYLNEVFFSNNSDEGVWKWDGETLEKSTLSGSGSSWKALNVHKGELWAASGFSGSGGIYRKGNGEELSTSYDDTKDEIEITAAVNDDILFLDVEGQQESIFHDVDYKESGSVRLGLSYGGGRSDQHAPVDESYKGAIREFLWYPGFLQDPFEEAASQSFFTATTSVTAQGDTFISGTASTNIVAGNITKIEVLAAPNSGGTFQVIEEVVAPSNQQVSWTHSGLITGEDYFYKARVTPGYTSVSPIESSEVSAVAEYQQSSAPTISADRTGNSVSGSVSVDGTTFGGNVQRYEIFRKKQSDPSFSKTQEVVTSNTTANWNDGGLDSVPYEYKAKVIDTDGGDTPFSTVVAVFPPSGTLADSDLAWGVEDLSG